MNVVERQPPYFDNFSNKDPAVFLAGPIQGAPDWQSQAVHTLSRTYQANNPLLIFNPRHTYKEGEFDYDTQVQWEKNHLTRSANLGAVLFWFAQRDESMPLEEGRPYAPTSRIEYGRIFGWKDYNPKINIVVGIEPGYVGSERYFRSIAKEFSVDILDSLDGVCDEVSKLSSTISAKYEVS